MTRARILIADDHRILAEGLQAMLETDYEIVGLVEDGEAMFDAVRELEPDLVVADISMPRLNGIECLRKLRAKNIETKVVLLTMHAEIEYATTALQEGASGYVLKDAGMQELKTAVAEALRGGVHISSSISREVVAALARHRPGGVELTARQRDVLSGVARGLTAKEIATELHLSPRTVESHKYQLMERVGASTTAELIQYAMRQGLGPV